MKKILNRLFLIAIISVVNTLAVFCQNDYDLVNLIGEKSFPNQISIGDNSSKPLYILADTLIVPKEGRSISFKTRKRGIYLICNKLILNGKLNINNQILGEEVLPERSGGILIASNEVDLNIPFAININNSIYRKNQVSGSTPTGRHPIMDNTILIFKKYNFDEKNIIDSYIKNAEEEFKENPDEVYEIINRLIELDFNKIPEFLNSKLQTQQKMGTTSAYTIDNNGNEVKMFPVNSMKNLGLFEFEMSKNFNDINNELQSSYALYNKIILDEDILPNQGELILNKPLNLFLNINSRYGSLNGKSVFLNDFNDPKNLHKNSTLLKLWELEILKFLNQEINLAIKDNDKKKFLSNLKKYKSFKLSESIVSNEKAALLKEINQSITQYENKYIGFDENLIYLIKDNNISFYSIPNSAKMVAYEVNKIPKLASIFLNDKKAILNFKIITFQSLKEIENIKKIINQYSGRNSGILIDWKLDSYESNIEFDNIKVKYIGNGVFDISLEFDSQGITLAKIINQPFYIILSGNYGENNKFKTSIPIELRLSTNENIKFTGSTIKDNYIFFEDLTSYQTVYQKISIYNNCRPLSEKNNKFEKIVVSISYNLNSKLQTYVRTLTTIGQNDTFDIPYVNSQPNFDILVEFYFENEIFSRKIKDFDRFQINIDGNFTK